MLNTLTRESFADKAGRSCEVRIGEDERVSLELVEVSSLGEAPEGGRAPFSLLFQGPGDLRLEQSTYRVEVPELGALDLFLVPLAPQGSASRFEAVFT